MVSAAILCPWWEGYISLHKMDYLQTVMLNVVKHLLQILR